MIRYFSPDIEAGLGDYQWYGRRYRVRLIGPGCLGVENGSWTDDRGPSMNRPGPLSAFLPGPLQSREGLPDLPIAALVC